MGVKDHWEQGFEKEDFAKQVCGGAREECNDLSLSNKRRLSNICINRYLERN
jgi:hypothetical protein